MTQLEKLYKTLNERLRPEDVAQMIIDLPGISFTKTETGILNKAARGSLTKAILGYTSMLQTFAVPSGAGKQIKKAIDIFQLDISSDSDFDKITVIESFIAFASDIINKDPGKNNFKADRLNKTQRAELGMEISKRNYNKKWRVLRHIEKKLTKLIRETQKTEFQKISKHGLAHTINFEDFSADINTACFIAYYNARCNLRSQFTNQHQERPFDEICDMLFRKCKEEKEDPDAFSFWKKHRHKEPKNTNWWAIAHIYSTTEVLSHLSDQHKGIILGKWTTILKEIASLLEETWEKNDIDRAKMIVKRGNDSSTWNTTAGAWNKARDNWINLIYSLGMEYLLEDLCFGKVLRLMAADVVAWHFLSGSKLDPNTEVWNKLPFPWDVLSGKRYCNKEMITKYCLEAGIDPEKSGWISPRVHGVSAFKPTPELVHGVSIENPFLAAVLKRHHYFSGKN